MIARRWRLPASVGAAICVGLALLAAAPARAAQSQPVIAAYSLAAPA
jgi:hypothetical protein